jgi:putative membrane protein
MRSSPTCSRSDARRVALQGFALAVALAGPAAAQMGNPGFMAAGTRLEPSGIPAPHQLNNADVLFVQLVGEGGLAEVSFADLALEKASTDSVRTFAERMRADHGAANDKLAGLARDAGIQVPAELNAEHAAMRRDLEAMDAATFELNYMRGQVVEHQKTALLLQWEIGSGQEPALQRFAADALPTVLEHLSMARGILEELSLQQVAATPPPPRND